MKRRRGEMEKGSEIGVAIEELSKVSKVFKTGDNHGNTGSSTDVDPDDNYIPTQPFLLICNLLLQVLDKIGPTMAVLRQDVHQNIQRVEKLCEGDPTTYSNLVEILKKEAREGNARTTNSSTRALVWLTRSMDFTAALLERLVKDPSQSMEKAVEESYTVTLKPWHSWISAAAYKVALKLVPESKTFMKLLMAEDEDLDTLNEEIKSLVSLLVPFLDKIHSTLIIFRADRLKSK